MTELEISENTYQDYYRALRLGDKKACLKIVERQIQSGLSVEKIFILLFQRSLYQVGEEWETGRLSVAREHIATAITDFLIGRLFPFLQAGEANGLSIVMACMQNEFHQIGARIIADLMESKGFDVCYLGANSPADSIMETVRQQQPHAAAFSLSLPANLPSLKEIVHTLAQEAAELPILLGGQAFRRIQNPFEDYPLVNIISGLPALYAALEALEKNAG
jgi:methanogenic corrinoid protein MtbC1